MTTPPRLAPNLLDRAIAVVAPRLAAQRLVARLQFGAIAAFTGSERGARWAKKWSTTNGSADADLLPELSALREGSREQVRNNPIACGAIRGIGGSVVGTGLALQSQVDVDALGWTADQADAWQRTTEREFNGWAETTDCDLTRHQDLYQQQRLVMESKLENGDLLVLLPFVPRPGSTYDLRVQLIEADRLCNKDHARDTTALAGGVEMDEHGAPKAYHILTEHPGNTGTTRRQEWQIVPAFGTKTGRRNVLHIFDRKRIGQTRGLPMLAPVMRVLKQLSRLSDAELDAAVAAGLLAVFVKSDRGGFNGALPGVASETGQQSTDDDVQIPGATVVDLKPGEEVSSATPGRPNPNFDPFFQSCVRQIGIGIEIPYEVLIKHFTASYTAARAAIVEAWKYYRNARATLVQQFCQPVFEAFMEEAVASGRIDAPGFFDDPALRRAYCGARWQGDAMPQVDPVKEVTAAKERVDLGVSDLSRETSELTGGDWETTHRQQVREKKMRLRDGLDAPAPAAPPAAPTPAPAATPDANPDANPDGTDTETPPGTPPGQGARAA